MSIFSKKKEESKLVLVFDIGSSSVGGALFEVQKTGIPKIILSIRESIVLEEQVDAGRFSLLTIQALELVVNKICLKGIGQPTKIFCVLSSAWHASQTRIIKLEKNVPFLFTTKLADSLIQKEISFLEEEYLQKFSEVSAKIRPIEFKSIKTLLNGYVTTDPFNKKTKKLEMVIFVSLSEEFFLKEIEKIIFKHFHTKEIRFSSFTLASFIVARDVFLDKKDFLLLDIAGEVTDVAIVKNEILNNSISFPLGRNFMIRKIAEKMHCDLSEAQSLFSLYKDKHAGEVIKKKLEPLMSKLENEWLSLFQKSLVSLSENISVPNTIFITVDQGLFDFFSDIIKNEKFSQQVLTDSKFEVVFLDGRALHGFTTFKDNQSRDPFLMIEAIYLNRFFC